MKTVLLKDGAGNPHWSRSIPLYAMWLVLPAIILLGTMRIKTPRRRNRLSYCLAFLLIFGSLLLAACGGGASTLTGVGIPVKMNVCSEGKPNGVPE